MLFFTVVVPSSVQIAGCSVVVLSFPIDLSADCSVVVMNFPID